MSDEQFNREYLGRFPDGGILRALKKSYVAVADKDRQIFLPQSIIKRGIDAIKYGEKPEDVLFYVLESMGTLVNEMHKQAMIRGQLEVKPIMVMKPKDDK